MADLPSLNILEHPVLAPQTRDIIGFDLGHGDTSVSRVSASGGAAQQLEIVKGEKVIPTAFGEGESGSLMLGEHAFLANKSNAVSQFKSPHVDDPTVAEPLKTFVREALRRLQENAGTIPFDGSTLLVFGCPSAWDPQRRLAYGRLLASQANGMQTMLIPESRAAMVTMKEDGALTKEQLLAPTLIIDAGSSTTDFTYMEDLKAKELPVGSSYPLGASTIERNILEMALNQHPDRTVIEAWWKNYPGEYHRTLMAFRRAKETYFKAEDVYRDAPPQVVTVVFRTQDGKLVLEADLAADDFEAALDRPIEGLGTSPTSWRTRFRSDLEEATQWIADYQAQSSGSHDGPPARIILTGGAARMAFMLRLAKEVFSEPTVVVLAPAPEHAISVGLAHAGSIHYRAQAFRAEVEALVRSDEVEEVLLEHMPAYAEAVADAVSEGVTEHFIVPAFLKWRKSGRGKLKDVAAQISKDLEAWHSSSEGQKAMLARLEPWYRQISQAMHEVTAPLCMKYGLAADVLDIPHVPFKPRTSGGGVNPDETLFGSARAVLSAVLATVSFVTGVLLFGTGTAILAPTGPFAPIIAGFILWIMGEAGKEKAMEWIMEQNLPGMARKLYPESSLRNNLMKKADEGENKIRSEVLHSLLGEDEEAIANKTRIINDLTAGIEESLKKRAEEVSVLIA